jgi:hypothetical protein
VSTRPELGADRTLCLRRRTSAQRLRSPRSCNPGGRRKNLPPELRDAARALTPKVLDTLEESLADKSPTSVSPRHRGHFHGVGSEPLADRHDVADSKYVSRNLRCGVLFGTLSYRLASFRVPGGVTASLPCGARCFPGDTLRLTRAAAYRTARTQT